MQPIDKIEVLRNKLLKLSHYKKNNRLDFMLWDKYPRQNDMRVSILQRFETKEGPNFFVVFGSNRSGKSELGGGVVAEIFGKGSNLRIWCATLSDLSIKVQQRKLSSLIRKNDLQYGEYNEVRGWKNRTLISKTGNVIYLKTYEQGASAFQGDDVDLVWLDEEPPFDVFSEIVIRLADRRGILLATFTSLQGFTRLVNRLWNSDDPNIKATVLVAKENPFLSEESKKQLKESIDPDELESRWEGKPHIKQGLIYKDYSETHRIKRFDYKELVKGNPKRWEIHEGIDPHERTPHHWIRFLYDTDNDILYTVEELRAPKESMLISDFAKLIKYKRDGLTPLFTQIDTSSMKPDIINVHPSEYQENFHTVRGEFMRCGINTILCSKDNAIGIGEVKRRIKTVRTLDGTIKKHPTFRIFDDLKGIHAEFLRYSWDSYSSDKVMERKEMINKPIKKDDHFMDIIKYECIKLRSELYGDSNPDVDYQDMYEGTGY